MRKRLSFAMLIFAAHTASAAPAYPYPVEIEQPDGTTATIRIHGDEHSNYVSTLDGYPIVCQPDGYFYYLDKNLAPTSTKVSSPDIAKVAELKKHIDKTAVAAMIYKKAHANTENTRLNALMQGGRFPATGSHHTLVILAEFTDQPFSTDNPQAAFHALLNEEGYSANGATGSCRDYYKDNSNGVFTPVFDVFGPVLLSHDYRYYGQNSMSGSDLHAGDMVIEACQALDDEIDFSAYDIDNDGLIDNVYVFYSGYGAADSGQADRIWPHASDLSDKSVYLDGKKLGNYACSNEIKHSTGKMCGIGTFTHEFGHCLGLPDMYNTLNQSASFTPGEWDMMDYGMYNNDMNTPPFMTAFERYSLGWMEPVELNQPDNVCLSPIHTNEAYIIRTNTQDEYFLLENRQQKGWDAYIPGHGMLVWHIDYVQSIWDENRVNTNPNHLYADIEEADNIQDLETLSGDPFPGSNGITAITDDTRPNLRTWTGIGFGKTVTEIEESEEGIISFRFRGGATLPNAPEALPATEITPVSFTANWTAVEGAEKYILNIYTAESGSPIERFTDIDAGNALAFTADHLDPSTTYAYTVKAADKYSLTEPSNKIEVTTLEPTFDLLRPECGTPSDINDTEATIHIKPLEKATGYYIKVYTKQRGAATHEEILDFTDGATVLPQGWVSTSTSTIRTNGYFGNAAPALVLSANGHELCTPIYEDEVTGFSLWLRGRSDITGNHLIFKAFDGILWNEILKTEIPAEARTIDIDADLLESGHAVKVVYEKLQSQGNAIIDDVTVETGAWLEKTNHEDYNDSYIGNLTTFKLQNLSPSTTYYYTVTATNGSTKSRPSIEGKFSTTEQSGGIELSNTFQPTITWIASHGSIKVRTSGNSPIEATVYTTTGTMVSRAESYDGQEITIDGLESGVYILHVNNQPIKIIL